MVSVIAAPIIVTAMAVTPVAVAIPVAIATPLTGVPPVAPPIIVTAVIVTAIVAIMAMTVTIFVDPVAAIARVVAMDIRAAAPVTALGDIGSGGRNVCRNHGRRQKSKREEKRF
jgi:hypothetical protein